MKLGAHRPWRMSLARRSRVAATCGCLLLILAAHPHALAQSGYTSPFSITLAPDIATWTTDFASREQAIVDNSSPTQSAWYTTSYGSTSYGPLNPQLYSTASIVSPNDAASLTSDRGQAVYGVHLQEKPAHVSTATWQQQRVLAAANALLTATNGTTQGTAYQHLHLPTFNPASVTNGTFPWSAVSTNPLLHSSWQLANSDTTSTVPNPYAATYGTAAPGIDCTDFSAYVYSLALGIQMHSGTPSQVQFTGASQAPAPGATAFATVLDTTGAAITPQFFYSPNFGTGALNSGSAALAPLISQFQAGDLLYMGDTTEIRHVVMWLGQTGTDSAGNVFPLVISSHDNTPAIFDTLALSGTGYPLDGDIAGHLPPPGVHILPFAPSNWFYQDFQVAMRVLETAVVPEVDPNGFAGVAALVTGVLGLIERRLKRTGAMVCRRQWPGASARDGSKS